MSPALKKSLSLFAATAALPITLAMTLGLAACGPADVAVTSYTSDPTFAVGSYLIAGEKEAVLVDGQFFKADAQKVAQLVKD